MLDKIEYKQSEWNDEYTMNEFYILLDSKFIRRCI